MELLTKKELTKEDVLAILRQNIATLKADYHVKTIGIFGSFARGENTKKSDIDFFVEFDQEIGFEFGRLVRFLERLFNREVEVLTPWGVKSIRSGKIRNEIERTIVYA